MRGGAWAILAGAGLVLTEVGGCTPGNSASRVPKTKTVTINSWGGLVTFASSSVSTVATAWFTSGTAPVTVFQQTFGDGSCLPLNYALFPSGSLPYIDAGPAVDFVSGSTSLSAPAQTSSGLAFHYGYQGGPVVGTTWLVMISGTSSGLSAESLTSFDRPGSVSYSAGPVITGQPLTIAYSGTSGADFIDVSLTGSTGSVHCFPAANATSFTIPATVTGEVGSGGTVTLTADNVGDVGMADRQALWLVSRAP